MIPSIEQIVEDVKAGTITTSQAVTWLHQHAAGAVDELRDFFAAEALVECIRVADHQTPRSERDPKLSALFQKAATYAYFAADAMLAARSAS